MSTENDISPLPASPKRRKSLDAPKAAHLRDPQLRAEAGLFYMTDQSAPTLEQMSQDARFSAVTKKTLERWSIDDKWVERRAEFFKKWTARAMDRMGTEICKLRQRDLGDLETIRTKALEWLADAEIQPRSWEGVAKVLMEASDKRTILAEAIGQELMPSTTKAEIKPEDVGTNSAELQLAAKSILAHRRAALAGVSATPIGRDAGVVVADVALDLSVNQDGAVPQVHDVEVLLSSTAGGERPPLSLGLGDEDDEDADEDEQP